jgi:hypothetical protein
MDFSVLIRFCSALRCLKDAVMAEGMFTAHTTVDVWLNIRQWYQDNEIAAFSWPVP